VSMRSRARRLPPGRWQVWSLRREALVWVLIVDAMALAVLVLSFWSTFAEPGPGVTSTQWIQFAVLAVAATLHLEATRRIERRRELAMGGKSPYTNLKSLWLFAGILLLPLSLVAVLVVLSFVYCWVRVYGPTIAYRKVYSVASSILPSAAAIAVLQAGGLSDTPRIPTGPWSLLLVLVAGVVWWFINYGLIVAAIMLSDPQTPARTALGELADQFVIAAGLGLGTAVAALQTSHPWVVPVLMVTVLALHQTLLLPQLRHAAMTDAKTGLATPTFWSTAVPAELARAETLKTTVGLLMLDLDEFKYINDTFGHPAGDQALCAVAAAIRAEVRHNDLVARLGGDEMAVLVPGVDQDELLEIAERIRVRLAHITLTVEQAGTSRSAVIDGVPASFGAAVYPYAGSTMDQLVLAADAALLNAKRAGRNRVVPALSEAS
jgi:diguanylate cyclase (GGDEF)-like protein